MHTKWTSKTEAMEMNHTYVSVSKFNKIASVNAEPGDIYELDKKLTIYVTEDNPKVIDVIRQLREINRG